MKEKKKNTIMERAKSPMKVKINSPPFVSQQMLHLICSFRTD